MKNRVVEMMTKVQYKHYTVRVWSIAKPGDFGPDARVANALMDIKAKNPAPAQIRDALEELGTDVVAAYEITNEGGHGVVVYPDWK